MQLVHDTRLALGSDVTLVMVGNNKPLLLNLLDELWLKIFNFEKQFSRFLPSSELSVFNRNAGTRQYVSDDFLGILRAASEMSDQTGGLYNPFILPALQRAGYVGSRVEGYRDDPVDDYSNRFVTDYKKLKLGKNWAEIPYGTAIDLGGCGKGYLADLLRSQIDSQVSGYWFSLGGDVSLAGRDEQDNNWKVSIVDTNEPDREIGFVILPNSNEWGVATSGVTVNKGVKNGVSWHHIIDPITLKPSQTDVQLATVITKPTLQADVLASCAVLLGSSKALKYLKSHSASASLVVFSKEGQPIVDSFGKCVTVNTGHHKSVGQ